MQTLMINALVTLLVQRSRCRELTPSSGGHSNCRLLLNADRCFGDLLTGLWKQGGSEDRSKEAVVGNRPGALVVIQKMMIATTMIMTWSNHWMRNGTPNSMIDGIGIDEEGLWMMDGCLSGHLPALDDGT